MDHEQIVNEINIRKQLLTQTDYQCLKFAEGSLSEKEYAPIREQRQKWRDEINTFEAQLEE